MGGRVSSLLAVYILVIRTVVCLYSVGSILLGSPPEIESRLMPWAGLYWVRQTDSQVATRFVASALDVIHKNGNKLYCTWNWVSYKPLKRLYVVNLPCLVLWSSLGEELFCSGDGIFPFIFNWMAAKILLYCWYFVKVYISPPFIRFCFFLNTGTHQSSNIFFWIFHIRITKMNQHL